MILSRDEIKYMGDDPIRQCDKCTNWTRMNYCMDHDQFFYAGHGRACANAEHVTCRTY